MIDGPPAVNPIENVLGEHRSTTPLALDLSKVLLYSVQIFFWFPVLFLIAYLHRHMGSPKERSIQSFYNEDYVSPGQSSKQQSMCNDHVTCGKCDTVIVMWTFEVIT